MIQYIIILIFSGICVRRHRRELSQLGGVDEEGGEQLVFVMGGRMSVNNTILILHSIFNMGYFNVINVFTVGGNPYLVQSP